MPDNTSTTPNSATPATPLAGGSLVTPQPQAGTTTPPEPQAGEGQTAADAISLEEARKLRKEAQALRQRLKGYEDQEEAAKLAALSDVEKANKQIADANAKIKQYQQELVLARVTNAAHAKGIIDPELAALAIQSKLEYDDSGMPSNLDKALDELIKNKPFLVAQASSNPAQTASTANRGAPATPAMNPGRTNISQPNTVIPGQRRKLSEFL